MTKLTGRVDELGEYLREQRIGARLSVRELAKVAGVSNPYLSQIERGLRKPSAEVLQQLANGLRISAEALYVRAGILDSEGRPDVETAIASAPLTDRQRRVLLDIYASFVAENERAAAGEDVALEPSPETVAARAAAAEAGREAAKTAKTAKKTARTAQRAAKKAAKSSARKEAKAAKTVDVEAETSPAPSQVADAVAASEPAKPRRAVARKAVASTRATTRKVAAKKVATRKVATRRASVASAGREAPVADVQPDPPVAHAQ